MAIYALAIKHKVKGKGASAGAHAVYIAREGKYAEKPSQSHAEYLTREGKHVWRARELEATWSGNMPDWAKSGKEFWEASDTYERANGRVYTEIVVALPRELSREERMNLVGEFIGKEIGERFPYTVAIHNPKALDGGEQPHAHIMFSIRERDGIEREREQFFKRANDKSPEKGGAKKSREWSKDSRENDRVGEIRLSWETLTNKALERAGYEVRIDRRTLEAQGIDREPEPKMGPEVTQRIKRGQETEIGQKVLDLRAYKARREELLTLEREHREELAKVYEFQKEKEARTSKNEISLEGLESEPLHHKSEYLEKHFTRHEIQGGLQFRRKSDGELAFTDNGKRIEFQDISFESIRAGIERAEEKGWQRIRVRGSEEFRQRYFIEATARGREVVGYRPGGEDLRRVEELKRALEERSREKTEVVKTLPAEKLLEDYGKRQKLIQKEWEKVEAKEMELGLIKSDAGYRYPPELSEESAVRKAENLVSGGRINEIKDTLKEKEERALELKDRILDHEKEKFLTRVFFTPLEDGQDVKSLLRGVEKEIKALEKEGGAIEKKLQKPAYKELVKKRAEEMLREEKELWDKRRSLRDEGTRLRETSYEMRRVQADLKSLGDRDVRVSLSTDSLYEIADKKEFMRHVREKREEFVREQDLKRERSRSKDKGLGWSR
jgi:hypothetical protein